MKEYSLLFYKNKSIQEIKEIQSIYRKDFNFYLPIDTPIIHYKVKDNHLISNKRLKSWGIDPIDCKVNLPKISTSGFGNYFNVPHIKDTLKYQSLVIAMLVEDLESKINDSKFEAISPPYFFKEYKIEDIVQGRIEGIYFFNSLKEKLKSYLFFGSQKSMSKEEILDIVDKKNILEIETLLELIFINNNAKNIQNLSLEDNIVLLEKLVNQFLYQCP